MPKPKGRIQRKTRSDWVNFVMRLDSQLHQQLKRMAERQKVTMALLIERFVSHMMRGQLALEARQESNEAEDVFDWQVLSQEIQAEVEALLADDWIGLSPKRQLALVYLAAFPFESPWRLGRMSGISRQWITQVKRSSLGIKVLDHFASRSLWSRRPEILEAVIDRAVETDNPAWAELAMRFFGDYGMSVNQLQVSWEVAGKKAKLPMDLEQHFIEQAKLLKMTPKRFKKLWQQESTRARLTETSASL